MNEGGGVAFKRSSSFLADYVAAAKQLAYK